MALAILLQYTLPGAAHIYYGDEIGLRSRHDSKTQADMSWDERSKPSYARVLPKARSAS